MVAAVLARVKANEYDGPFPGIIERIDLRKLYPDRRGNLVFVHCPWHKDERKPNMAVYRKNAYCWVCRRSEAGFDHIRRVKGTRNDYEMMSWALKIASDEVYEDEAPQAPLLPLDQAIAKGYAEKLWDNHREGVVWLEHKYGLWESTVAAAQIGHTGYAYTIPIYKLIENDNMVWSELMTVRYRIDPEKFPSANLKYYGTTGRNQPMFYYPPAIHSYGGVVDIIETLQLPRSIVLVEGEFNALALDQAGVLACSVTNGAGALLTAAGASLLDEMASWGIGVYVAFDQDYPGRSGGLRVWKELRRRGVDAHRIKWSNSLGHNDVADLVAAGYAKGAKHDFRTIFQIAP